MESENDGRADVRDEIEHARHCAMTSREWAAEEAVNGEDERAASLLAGARRHADRARMLATRRRAA